MPRLARALASAALSRRAATAALPAPSPLGPGPAGAPASFSTASAPLLQKAAAGGGSGKKGSGGAAAAAPAAEVFDLAKVVPSNLLKDGADPELKADADYPDWVFRLTDEKPILEDLVMRGLEHVADKDMKRVFRLANKRRIKAANLASAKAT